MAGYFTFDPSTFPSVRAQGGAAADGDGPLWGNSAAFGPLGRELQRTAATFWADNAGGNEEERTLNRAVNRFRNKFTWAWNRYGALQGQDALEGYGDFSNALDKGRDGILASVTGPARDMVKPVLERLHLEALQIGLAHWDQHSRALAPRRVQFAQVEPTLLGDRSTLSDRAGLSGVTGEQRSVQLAQNFGGNAGTGDSPTGEHNPRFSSDESNAPSSFRDLGVNVDLAKFTEQEKLQAKKIAGQILAGKVGVWNWNIGNTNEIGWAGTGAPFRGFAAPISPIHGVRLNTVNLLSHGKALTDSLEPFDLLHIAERWTSRRRGDDPAAWARGVSYWSTIPEDAIIDPKDEKQLALIMFGIMMQEKGNATVRMDDIREGVRFAVSSDYPIKSPEQTRKDLLEAGFQSYANSPLWPLIFKELNEQFFEEVLQSKKDDKRRIDLP